MNPSIAMSPPLASITVQSNAPAGASTARQAEQRLRRSSYPAHRKVRCSFHEGVLTLRGRLPCYYLRQLACVLVSDVEGVEELKDCIEVSERR
ncbi:MAG TPA: BON domain-containing protein [Pirellulales bacterium]|jgi:hypothetical protein|nr:BON domain-containing protein [Pirellulales bacterium]